MTCLHSYLYSYIFPFIMYCLRHLLLFTCKQDCLQTCKYDQSLSITEAYTSTKFHVSVFDVVYGFLFELWVFNLNDEEEKKMNIVTQYIYVAIPIYKGLPCFVINRLISSTVHAQYG